MNQRHDFASFLIGGILVFLFFWFRNHSGQPVFSNSSESAAPGSSVVPAVATQLASPCGGGCGCGSTSEQPSNIPILISSPDINATSGRYIAHEGYSV